MYRVRLHGRGGHGIKTASRILGSALFLEGFEVQDAPRYGAERRGAPIFAYVRAAREPIYQRGVIDEPDLVTVSDDSLMQTPAAGVHIGLKEHAVLLIRTRESADTWKRRMSVAGTVLTLPIWGDPQDRSEQPGIGAQCAGAAARLLGEVSRASLEQAIDTELGHLEARRVRESQNTALDAYDAMSEHTGIVSPHALPSATDFTPPRWEVVPFEDADISAPSVHASATSNRATTAPWRTMRPIIDHESCHRCHWMCAFPCPDSAIKVDAAGLPHIDLDHCKGCLICVAQCPFHVISAIPEHHARQEQQP